MVQATYQTRVPDNLIAFCEDMGLLFGNAERHLYVDLRAGEKLNTLKKEYQVKYGINARQFNSVHSSINGKIASRNECLKRQVNELKSRIEYLKKSIESRIKKLKKAFPSCGVGKGKAWRAQLRFELHQKKQKLESLQAKCQRLKDTQHAPLIFGSRKLWQAQHNLEANGYGSHQEWLEDWQTARSSQFMLVGSKNEPNGNRNCQLEPNGTLRVAVPYSMGAQYGERLSRTKINYLTTFKSERIPANYSFGLPEDRARHVWSYWNRLGKKLKGVSRHCFFSMVANSESEVNLPGEVVVTQPGLAGSCKTLLTAGEIPDPRTAS